MKKLFFVFIVWPILSLNTAAAVLAETLPAAWSADAPIPANTRTILLPGSHMPDWSDAYAYTLNTANHGLSRITGHIAMSGHSASNEWQSQMRKTTSGELSPGYITKRIAHNWNIQATLMMGLIIMMWPMGKRKLALAGLRLLFRKVDKIMKRSEK
jgi:hypothetical protein